VQAKQFSGHSVSSVTKQHAAAAATCRHQHHVITDMSTWPTNIINNPCNSTINRCRKYLKLLATIYITFCYLTLL